MSLEVGEHLPEACIPNYLAHLNASAIHGVVLSWGADSRGRGHVSPRSARMVEKMLAPYGLAVHWLLSSTVRSHAMVPWLRADVRVYLRNATALRMRVNNFSFPIPPWPSRGAMIPERCRVDGDRCAGQLCKSKYARRQRDNDCYTMASRCPCSFAVSPDWRDAALEERLARQPLSPRWLDADLERLAVV